VTAEDMDTAKEEAKAEPVKPAPEEESGGGGGEEKSKRRVVHKKIAKVMPDDD